MSESKGNSDGFDLKYGQRPKTAQEKVDHSGGHSSMKDPPPRPRSSHGESSGDMGVETAPESSGDDLRCPICMDFFIEPTITDCAHVFCSFCIGFWFENRGRPICPQCRNTVERVIPSPDLNAKVEAYVSSHLTKEQLEERQRTRQRRAEDMRNASQSLPQLREQIAMYGGDVDDLFWSFTVEQPDDPTGGGGFSFWTNVVPGYGHQHYHTQSLPDLPPSPEFQDDLAQFEFRLERAQEAYNALLNAQHEMNHQMEHLSTISTRLEAYNSLRERTRGCFPCTTVEISTGGPDVLTGADASDSNYFDSALPTSPPAICTDCIESWPWLPCTSYQYYPAGHQESHGGSNNSYHETRECHSSCRRRSRSRRARTRTFRRHDNHQNGCTNCNCTGRYNVPRGQAWEIPLFSGDHGGETAGSRPGTSFSASISIETDMMPSMMTPDLGNQGGSRRYSSSASGLRSDNSRHSPTPSFMGL